MEKRYRKNHRINELARKSRSVGLTEAERADKQQFGEQRLLEWADGMSAKDVEWTENACGDLYDTVKRFTDGNEQNDDITIMTIDMK